MRKVSVAILALCACSACAGERFEVAALVDSFDFAGVKVGGAMLFDTETALGNEAVLEHVLLTGANTILWRNCGGATMRYRSDEERLPLVESPLDKRRLPDNRPVHGWLRYYQAEPDILRHMLGRCRAQGLGAGVHWPFEETHWSSWTFGGWNFEHPQYWGVTDRGQVWAGRCSLAFPEVVAHKLKLADELVARGCDHLLVDTWRNGGWGPEYEYVEPELARWAAAHPGERPPVPSDPRWCAFVAETTHAYFCALRKRLDLSGRKVRLLVGVSDVGPCGAPDATLLSRGVDWRRLVTEGVVDGLVVMSVAWDKGRAFESTRALYRDVVVICAGRCEVLLPVQAYDFSKRGIPSYVAATGRSAPVVAGELLKMAWEEGADGACLECVDYRNYSAETCAALRSLLGGACAHKRRAGGGGLK
jgi:hypothetical protein